MNLYQAPDLRKQKMARPKLHRGVAERPGTGHNFGPSVAIATLPDVPAKRHTSYSKRLSRSFDQATRPTETTGRGTPLSAQPRRLGG